MSSVVQARRQDAPAVTGSTRMRTDIQGLRALAVGLVLAFHAGLPVVTGGYVGVDVFFVISGFLITGLIVREIRATGRLSLGRFYARRARRLLPATAVVFVFVAVATVAILPATRWETIAVDLAAASLYVVNWTLASRSVDYLAEGQAASPLQHFWSLAVEEQFYVVWPLLIVALVWFARRIHGRLSTVSDRWLGAGLAAIVVPSLLWSVLSSASSPESAYFVTTTRLWELGIGALVAIVGPHLVRVALPARIAVGWGGLVAILAAAVLFDASTVFPGAAALLPTLGAAAVLWAGMGDGAGRVRLLGLGFLQDVGALSYSLYLWHWPVLVIAAVLWGDSDGKLWLPTAVLAVAASAVPAWFTYRTVERPLHLSPALARSSRAAIAGAACVVIGLGSAAFVAWNAHQLRVDAGDAEPLGASALGGSAAPDWSGELSTAVIPAPIAAGEDIPDIYPDGCQQGFTSPEVLHCSYGAEDSDVTVALVGDSHAAQWQPALRAIAEDHGWHLLTYTKASCPFNSAAIWDRGAKHIAEPCLEWNLNIRDVLAEDPPDILVVSSWNYKIDDGEGEAVPGRYGVRALADGYVDSWGYADSLGSKVVVINDIPHPSVDVPDCVAANATPKDPTASLDCSADRDEAVTASAAPALQLAAAETPVTFVDLTDWFCDSTTCPPVIGNVLVGRDTSHITATYALTLAPEIDQALTPLVDDM